MRHGSLFSGIGGFDLASEWMGWENVFHCEWNEFGQKVLKYYWPKAISYHDITKTDFSIHRGRIDIITGGFPCQPYSMAGKRLGKEDERHLWPEMLRAIREIQPTWVVGENVFGLVNWNGGLVFHEVQADLEAEGYEVQPYVLPAASVNAPHRRDRVWFVAYSKSSADSRDSREVSGEAKEENGGRIKSSTSSEQQIQLPTESGSLFGDDADSNGIGWNNRFNNWEERQIYTNKGTSKKSKSEWNGRECGIGKISTNASNTKSARTGEDIRRLRSLPDRHSDGSKDAKHSNSIGQEWRSDETNRKTSVRDFFSESNARVNQRNSWDNFPTQSPICTRDDGISDRLDSITFSKWRNESIKAGGNAIVPQVVHQIFKAIEQYETTRQT